MKAIIQWVLRTMMKDQTGIVRTMPKKDLVDFNVAMTAERLMRNGFDPNAFKNANQVESAINQIEAPRNQTMSIGEARGSGIKSAKVFDLEGKEIKNPKNIMGGKEIPDDDLPPPGSRGGPDDIAAPVQSAEETIKNMIEAENKKGIASIRNRKMVKDAIDNMSPGFVKGDRKYNAQLVADDLANKKFGKDFDDLDQRQQMDLYDEALKGLSEDMAQGGRAGFVVGGITGLTNLAMRLARGFMKVTGRKPNDEEIMKIIREAAERDFAKVSDDVALKGVSETRATARRMDSIDKDELKKAIDEYNIPVRTQEQFDFAQGGRAGFFMGGANPKGLGLLRAILNYMSKTGKETGRFKGVDLSGLDMLRLSNPKAFNKLLENVRGKVNIKEGIMGTDTVRAQQQALREKRKDLTEKSLDVAKAMKEDQDRIAKKIAEEAETTIIPEVKERLMKDMGMSEKVAEKAARDMAKAAQNIKPMDSPPEITDEGILQLENVLKNLKTGGKRKRELNAIGGRIGYKLGSIDKARRAFLKTLGAVGAGIGALKTGLLSIGKGADAVKNIPPIKTPVTKLEGTTTEMPEWFPSFINKFRDEGKATNVFKQKKVEVTKAEYDKAIAEGKGQNYFRDDARTPEYKANNPDHMDYGKLVDTDERIYTTYTNDKVPGVRVDDMDGNVDVMFENDYSQPVSINYTAPGKKGPETGRVDIFLEGGAKMETKPKGDFVANDVETYATDPDGGFDTEDIIADTLDDMMEGTTRQMEEYATGKPVKGLSKGEGRVVEREIQAEQAADAAAEAAAEAGDEFASGGIARMLGE